VTTEPRDTVAPSAFAALEKRCFPNPWGEKAFLVAPHRRYLSLWNEDACLAYLAALVVAGAMELLRIAVHPRYRRQGLARTLMTELMIRGVREGVARLFLEVSDTNAGAIAFYKERGFAITGRRRDYYGSGEDALIMSRALDQT
jgi:ribosomal-protein-alanine N-acetyltransferase